MDDIEQVQQNKPVQPVEELKVVTMDSGLKVLVSAVTFTDPKGVKTFRTQSFTKDQVDTMLAAAKKQSAAQIEKMQAKADQLA